MKDVIIIVIIVSVAMLMVIVINRTLVNLCKRLPWSNCSTALPTHFLLYRYMQVGGYPSGTWQVPQLSK